MRKMTEMGLEMTTLPHHTTQYLNLTLIESFADCQDFFEKLLKSVAYVPQTVVYCIAHCLTDIQSGFIVLLFTNFLSA